MKYGAKASNTKEANDFIVRLIKHTLISRFQGKTTFAFDLCANQELRALLKAEYNRLKEMVSASCALQFHRLFVIFYGTAFPFYD